MSERAVMLLNGGQRTKRWFKSELRRLDYSIREVRIRFGVPRLLTSHDRVDHRQEERLRWRNESSLAWDNGSDSARRVEGSAFVEFLRMGKWGGIVRALGRSWWALHPITTDNRHLPHSQAGANSHFGLKGNPFGTALRVGFEPTSSNRT